MTLLHTLYCTKLYFFHFNSLFNAQQGDAWIELVRLTTAKIDAFTLNLQLISTIHITVKPGFQGKEIEPLDLGIAPTPLMARLRPNQARVHEWKKRSTNRSQRYFSKY